MNTNQKGFASIVLIIALVVILAGGFGYFELTKKTDTPSTATTTEQATAQPKPKSSIPTGWVLYKNADIGIAFYHPASWGTIAVVRDFGCTLDENYYGKDIVAQIKKETALAPQDKCDQVRIGPASPQWGEKYPMTILVTTSPLYAKYPTPRGGFWGDYSGAVVNNAYVTNYCSKITEGECSVITNSQNIMLARYQGVIGVDDEEGVVYLANSTHPTYYGLSLSPSRLPAEYQKDFDKVLDTLYFLSQAELKSNVIENSKTFSAHPSIKAYLDGPAEITANTIWKGSVVIPQNTIGIANAPDVMWGDGTADPEFGGSPWQYDSVGNASITHKYTKPGSYTITVYINGSGGAGFEQGTVVIKKTIIVNSSTVSLDNRCIQKAVGTGMCSAVFRAVEFNQSTRKCEYVSVGGCNATGPFNDTTYQDSDKELNLCRKVCEGVNI